MDGKTQRRVSESGLDTCVHVTAEQQGQRTTIVKAKINWVGGGGFRNDIADDNDNERQRMGRGMSLCKR